MPAFTAEAVGKVILFGEHAVVYGHPAIAVPVRKAKTRVTVLTRPPGNKDSVLLDAPNIGIYDDVINLPTSHPLVQAITIFLDHQNIKQLPSCTIRIHSNIPIAAGMGSGAAVSVALYRALFALLGQPISDEIISNLAYEMEKVHHGTPSGIDNTVVSYEKPVFFIKGKDLQILSVAKPFKIIIGDTGKSSPTKNVVGEVRRGWMEAPEEYEEIFHKIGHIVFQAKQIIENGDPAHLGILMNENHSLLQQINVSSLELDHLVNAARQAGASGAKLSGSGWGGNMIALAPYHHEKKIETALTKAGAIHTIVTEIKDG